MSHKGVRLLIEDTAKSLGDDIQFTYGLPQDFNNLRDKKYPFITCDPLESTPVFAVNNVSNYTKSWSVRMAFYQLDEAASDQDQYKLILDEMDVLVDNFINKLNTYAFNQSITSDDIIITNINQSPFVKAMADYLSGYVLSFTVTVSNQFNYCGLGC